jgi:PAS domain S-box-containing protein
MNFFSIYIIIIIIAISGSAWIGLYTGNITIASYGAGFIPMAPATSLVFLINSFVYCILQFRREKFYYKIIAGIVIILLLSFLFIVLIHSFNNSWPDIEKIFVLDSIKKNNMQIGKMSPVTAVSFFIVSFVSLLLLIRKDLMLEIAAVASIIIVILSSVILIGYWYRSPLLYQSSIIPVALPTAICMNLSGILLITMCKDESKLLKLFTGGSVRSRLLRGFLPAVIAVALLEGWVNSVLLPHWHMDNLALAASLSAIFTTSIIIIVVFVISNQIGGTIDRAESALSESETRFRILFEWAPLGYQSLDSEGIILDVNHAWLNMLGYKKDEVIGRWFGDFISNDEDEPFCRSFEILKRENIINDKILKLQHKTGDVRIILLNGKIAYDDNLKFKQTHCILHDITEKMKAEELLKQINIELEDRVAERTALLEKANKELDSFSYSVSHDLRSPLRHITGFIEMFRLEAGDMLNDKAKHYMDVIDESARKMSQLIDDLLSFSRMGRTSLSSSHINLNNLVIDVLNDFSDDILDYKISVVRNSLPAIKGDRAMLRVVYVNLISNAIKFSKKKANPEIILGHEIIDGMDTFFVRDNGVGFNMEYAPKLFGLFQRIHNDRDFSGTGIGLAMVKNIIERHNGRIWAESEPDKGACFYFVLPGSETGIPDDNTGKEK